MSQTQSQSQEHAEETESSARWYRKRAFWGSVGAVIVGAGAVLGGVGAFMGAQKTPAPPPSPYWQVNCPKAEPPSKPGEPVNAFICYTWGSDGKTIGANTYAGPTGSMKHRKQVGGVLDGHQVVVFCQKRDGRQVTDDPHGPRLASSRVWNKIAGRNGKHQWVSDLYTNLPDKTGDKPPFGLPICS
jgi:hypothetical protein